MVKPREQLVFLIIGFPKSDTTSLHEYLLQHPKLFSSWLKEPHFFSYGYAKGINYYLKNFRFHNNSIYFESSTDYIYYPDVFKRIKQFNPNMKFIICLRNPIEQIFSHYNHLVQSDIEFDIFEDALLKDNLKKELHHKRLANKIYNNQKIQLRYYIYTLENIPYISKEL